MPGERRVRTGRVNAFAKINLTLRILGRRDDGYHEVRTRLQSLALHDSLTFAVHDGPFQITCDDPECPVDATNLVWRAAERLWRASGRRSMVSGVSVRIAKRIPMQAGLGGGSSDAAAALRALAKLWRLDLPPARMQRIAAELGADVPFFLQGGTAIGIERGDVVRAQPDAQPSWVVLVLPSFGVHTIAAYRWWDADNRAAVLKGRRVGIRAGREMSRVSAEEVSNDLEGPVARRHPQIGRIVRGLKRAGASHAAMSGSGSAVFGLFQTRAGAVAAAAVMSGRSCRTLVTRTIDRASYRRGTRFS